ncbi:hypothetical protein [Xylella fastidiosa]|uniref:Uncharacterized protein n=1 Tax=Xylella fastidiosa subsp. multiplex TaxID=644357 RepID=A0A9Q4MJS4_XYLFS|nr:hypothetical protein [Xylella fastidiosa]ERI60015.1 hypothetical protein M233_06540 [Xylella fastidiosa subsp. multiplex Griffin-1]KAJ4851925.1 hypothetical protein XYFPCFBP8418_008450 [Xylella fastidiosa subsp. multiplex]KFA40461.1 hypothetical protein DF22_002899 [Xylella fastidiosa]MBE0268600.1 hypothetical protein [Xylella fastidiosa subsp. multiplex]MBE0275356.1 hypothetical protein [Xylella fastidiosa subsp. multiplex]
MAAPQLGKEHLWKGQGRAGTGSVQPLCVLCLQSGSGPSQLMQLMVIKGEEYDICCLLALEGSVVGDVLAG